MDKAKLSIAVACVGIAHSSPIRVNANREAEMPDGNTSVVHPLFESGDDEMGRVLVDLIGQCIPEKDHPDFGLSEAVLDAVFDGQQGIPIETVHAILAHYRSRWPVRSKTDENYRIIEGIVNGCVQDAQPPPEEHSSENGPTDSMLPVERDNDVMSLLAANDVVARLRAGCKEHGVTPTSVAVKIGEASDFFGAISLDRAGLRRSQLETIAAAADLPLRYLESGGTPSPEEVLQAVEAGYADDEAVAAMPDADLEMVETREDDVEASVREGDETELSALDGSSFSSTPPAFSAFPDELLELSEARQVLGANLRRLTELGVSRRELAEAFGRSLNLFFSLDHGRAVLFAAELGAFCDRFGLRLSEFALLCRRHLEDRELAELFELEPQED